MAVVVGPRPLGVLGLVTVAGAQADNELPLEIKRGQSSDLEPRTMNTFFFFLHCLDILQPDSDLRQPHIPTAYKFWHFDGDQRHLV